MSLGIFICRRRPVSISGNLILCPVSACQSSPIFDITVDIVFEYVQTSGYFECNTALFIFSLHRHRFSYRNLSGASVVKLLRPVEPHGICVAERYGNYQNLWLMTLSRVSLQW